MLGHPRPPVRFCSFFNAPPAHQRTYFLNDPLSLYPMKYLGETFLPYDSLSETNILSTPVLSILNGFLFL